MPYATLSMYYFLFFLTCPYLHISKSCILCVCVGVCVYIFDLYYLYLRSTVGVSVICMHQGSESNAISILCMYVTVPMEELTIKLNLTLTLM